MANTFDTIVKDLVANATRVIIGYPSQDNGKATGLHYSIEYYAKESVNTQRSAKHQLTANVANKVLSDSRLHDLVKELVTEIATNIVTGGAEKSGLAAEEAEQAKNDAKVVRPARKKAAPKTAAKKVSVKPRKTTATKKAATAKASK